MVNPLLESGSRQSKVVVTGSGGSTMLEKRKLQKLVRMKLGIMGH